MFRPFFSFSQTQGPSGPIYASSNPEYLSANDGRWRSSFYLKVDLLWLLTKTFNYTLSVVAPCVYTPDAERLSYLLICR